MIVSVFFGLFVYFVYREVLGERRIFLVVEVLEGRERKEIKGCLS